MAIGSFVDNFADDFGKALQGIFNSQGDDAIKAARNILSNADDDIINKIVKDAPDNFNAFSGVIKKDLDSGLFDKTDMYKYAGLNGKEGATSLFSNKESFKGFEDAREEMMGKAAKAADASNNAKASPIDEEIKEAVDADTRTPEQLEAIKKYGNSTTKELKGDTFKSETGFRRFNASKDLDKSIEELSTGELEGKHTNRFRDNYKRITGKEISAEQLKDIVGNQDKLADFKGEYLGNMNGDDFTFSEMMGYYKVPQKVTGVMGTAWLVNKLASSGGAQTNAQLYGQEPY